MAEEKVSSMQAAPGLAQLERIEELIARKRQIFARYQEALSGVDGIMLNYEAPGTRNTYWMVTVVLDASLGMEKERLMTLLSERGIDSRPFFYPLSSLPVYEHLEQAQQARQRNRGSYQISPYGINLPCALNMTPEKIKYVCDALKRILQRGGSMA
jgi:perosamine synthetase